MKRYRRVVREAASVIDAAVRGAVESLNAGSIQQEPAFTDRMLGRIEQALDGFRSRGIVWRAKTLTDRGLRSQEKEIGADFAGVLDISIDGYQVTKGFLAQAKLLERGLSLGGSELGRLRKQCAAMLTRSSAAYVFVYSRDGIVVLPALSVVSSNDGDLHSHYHRNVKRFYEEHFTCFIGDQAISAPTPQMLKDLPERLPAARLLAIQAGTELAKL